MDGLKSKINELKEVYDLDDEDTRFPYEIAEQAMERSGKEIWEIYGDLTRILHKRSIKKAITFYSSNFSVSDFISRMQLEQHGCMIGDFLQQISDATVHKYPEVFLDLPPKDSDLHWGYSRFNDLDYISTFAYKCAKEFRTLLSEINAIAPLRNSPKRWYTYSGITPENTGYRAQTLPDLLFTNPYVVNKTNEWFKRLGIEYQMKIGIHPKTPFTKP